MEALKAEYQVAVTNSSFQDLNGSAISIEESSRLISTCYVEVRNSLLIIIHPKMVGRFSVKQSMYRIVFFGKIIKGAGGAIYLEPAAFISMTLKNTNDRLITFIIAFSIQT